MAIGGSASADACGVGETETSAPTPTHAVAMSAITRCAEGRFFIKKNARRFGPLSGGAPLLLVLEPQRQ
jgi:hypothetical protein